MRACWMFMILLSCRLPHATQSHSICKDQVEILCVPANGNASVPCPVLKGSDVNFKLFKDDKMIYSLGPGKNNTSHWVSVELHQDTEMKSGRFMLTGLNASSYGIYRCESIINFPPPYKILQNGSILVLVEGYQCKLNETSSKPMTSHNISKDQNNGFIWIWILVLVLFGIYSLIVTIIACIIWVKWRRADSQSDYMNTKPKATRNRKKKGFQNPIPRHF